MLRDKTSGRNGSPEAETHVEPLFAPREYGPVQPSGGLTRTVFVVVLAVLLTLLVVGASVGGFLVYNGQRNDLSDLRSERSTLLDRNERLLEKLGQAERQSKTRGQELRATKKKLQKARADVAAAKQDATAQFGAGFSAGTSSGYAAGSDDSYDSGWNDGWDAGYDSAYSFCSSVTYC